MISNRSPFDVKGSVPHDPDQVMRDIHDLDQEIRATSWGSIPHDLALISWSSLGTSTPLHEDLSEAGAGVSLCMVLQVWESVHVSA